MILIKGGGEGRRDKRSDDDYEREYTPFWNYDDEFVYPS